VRNLRRSFIKNLKIKKKGAPLKKIPRILKKKNMKFTITITNCLISSTFQKKSLTKKKVEIKLITELDYKKSLLYISTKKTYIS